VYGMAADLNCNIALFSLDNNSVRVAEHCKGGGLAAVVEDDCVVIRQGSKSVHICSVSDVPLTFGGMARCMVQNVLAAVLASYALKKAGKSIEKALRNFQPSPELTPGRMNMFDFKDFNVLVDYAHNAGGIKEISAFLKNLNAPVNTGIITAVGDRRDEDVIRIGELCGKVFDQIIIRLDKDLRGRSRDSMVALLQEGIKRSNAMAAPMIIPDERDALRFAVESAVKNSVITIFTEDVEEVCTFVKQLQDERAGQHAVPESSLVLQA
jgi:cyanophycin synthetase